MVRMLIAAGAILIGSAVGSQAQWYGGGYGYAPPPPPPPAYGYSGGYRPGPYGYGPRPYRRCWVRPGPWGPERVCRRW